MDVLENDVLAFALIERRRVLNVHMDMGSVAVAGIAALSEFLADGHVLAGLHLHRSPLQLRDENESVSHSGNDDMVPGRILLVSDPERIVGKSINSHLHFSLDPADFDRARW